MTRVALLICLGACGPITTDDFEIPSWNPTDPSENSTGVPGEPCGFLPGEALGPCLEDGTCLGDLVCLSSLESLGPIGNVCLSFCTPKCDLMCEAPEGSHSCNPAGLCTMPCKGLEDTESCFPGQICTRGGDTAPWECFWSKG